MKFCQLLEYPKINIFYQKLWKIFLSENDAGELVPVHFWFFKKPLYYVKTCGLQLDFTISIALKLAYNRNKLLKTLHYWSRDMLNFYFLYKGLGMVSPGHFVYDFSTKMFLMLYSINRFLFLFFSIFISIAWLPLLLEIFDNMCIAIVR